MREDSVGFFWQDLPEKSSRGQIIRPMPPIPNTHWEAPRGFPRLTDAPVIAIDTETYDPELLTRGPGWARGKGNLVGVSLAVPGKEWYFPLRHTVQPETNLLPEPVLEWLKDTLRTQTPKVGANLIYDIGWLSEEGIEVGGDLFDVQFAEALLEERSNVDLDALAQKYLGLGKETEVVYQWCSDFYGGSADGGQRKNLWRAPPCLVGPYAEADARLPLQILTQQWPLLEREGLLDVFHMENGLIPLLVAMRRAGVRVDIARAQQTRDALVKRVSGEVTRLRELVGFEVNINAADSIAKAFDKAGIGYGKTKTGKPSFTKEFLLEVDHPVAKTILEIRRLEKLRGTFIESYILDSNINGRVFGQFHPLRGTNGGTRSGRLASSTPNLQNLPARDEEIAPLIRGIFVPDLGHKQWWKVDYSQIEYRFMIHYAIGAGAAEARAKFNRNPNIDYHDMTLEQVAPYAGWDLEAPGARKKLRRPIKNINFGLIYGMGVPKLTRSLHLSKKEGANLFQAYHRGVPFAKPTMDAAMEEASATGIITTIFGRRSRFDLWEPTNWGDNSVALPYEKAILRYGNIRRAYTHKALNRRLQGSAADLMKIAMLKCWKSGVFDQTGVPRLTVHDELDFSDHGRNDNAYREMVHILETALPISIPIRADVEIGADWGHTLPVKNF